MKALILATSVLLSAPAVAEDDFCTQIHTLGETIMGARQKGMSLPTMMGTLQGNLKELLTPIVMEAYSHPLYSTPEIKKKTVSEFANSLQLKCMRETN